MAVLLALLCLPLVIVSGQDGVEPEEAFLSASTTDIALAAGLRHSLVLNYDGRVLSFGDNTYGQLGDGTVDSRSRPTLLDIPTDVVSIAAGAWHSLAVTSDGSVYAWGRNLYGQLGSGDTVNSSFPTRIEGLPPVIAVSAGDHHSLALTMDGAIYAWGRNTELQVGDVESVPVLDTDGSTLGSRVLLPVAIVERGVVAIAAGGDFSMYLLSNGRVMAFGSNTSGQLGDGTTMSRGRPAEVHGLSSVVKIAAGADHALAIMRRATKTGTVSRDLYAWGADSAGQLGQGRSLDSDPYSTYPVRVDLTGDTNPDNDNATLIAAGAGVSLAVQPFLNRAGARKSRILVFGSNTTGALGLGSVKASPLPRPLVAESNGWTGSDFLPFEAIATSGYHTLIVGIKGQFGGMGRNESGQLGDTTLTNRLVPVSSLLPDRIAPSWTAASIVVSTERTANSITLSWPPAIDNHDVAGYEIGLIGLDGMEKTLASNEGRIGVLTGFDTDAPQTFRIYAYDAAGNRATEGLPFDFVPEGMTYEEAFPTGDPEDPLPTEPPSVSPMEPSPMEPSPMEPSPTGPSPSGPSDPTAVPTEEPLPTPDESITPLPEQPGEGLEQIPGPDWNADEFGQVIPLEVPWDVDSFYGAGVVSPPPSMEPAVVAVILAFFAGFVVPLVHLVQKKVSGVRP